MPINEYGIKADTPTPPTNEDVGRSCVSVSLPTGGRGSPCDHYPWYIGFIMQGSTPAPTPSPRCSQYWRPAQTSSLVVLTSSGWLLKHVRWATGRYASFTEMLSC